MQPGCLGGEYYQEKIHTLIKKYKGSPNSPSILELCSGSGPISKYLSENLLSPKITCADIYDYSSYIKHADFLVSDAFSNVSDTYDVIVCSPPWFNKDYVDNIHPDLDPRMWQDLNWKFHKSFYNHLAEHLNPKGIALVTNTYKSQHPDFWKSMCSLELLEIASYPAEILNCGGFYENKIRDENYILAWSNTVPD